MQFFNYHHLRIFWAVAREGSLRAAAQALNLTQPTLSAQIHQLEDTLGHPLFLRAGRRLVLTEEGRLALSYAEEIFSLGRELQVALERRDAGVTRRLNVGVVNSLPKLMVRELLRPVFRLQEPVRVICQEGSLDELAERLSQHRLDVLLADEALSGERTRRAFNHPLGTSAVLVCGVQAFATRLRRDFPRSLNDVPMLLPTEAMPMRRALEAWFREIGVHPRLVAEFDDPALMKDFAADGLGVVPVHAAAVRQVTERYGLRRIGVVPGLRTPFFAISAERRLRNEAVVAITAQAQDRVFA